MFLSLSLLTLIVLEVAFVPVPVCALYLQSLLLNPVPFDLVMFEVMLYLMFSLVRVGFILCVLLLVVFGADFYF